MKAGIQNLTSGAMRSFFLGIYIIGLISFSHKSQGQGYDLKFEVEGLPAGEIYMGYHFGEQRYLKDTTQIQADGSIRFQGDESLTPGIYFLYNAMYYLEFIAGEPSFTLKTSKDGGYSALEVEGSEENEIFKQFQLGMIGIQQKKQTLTAELSEAQSREDSAAVFESIRGLDKEASEFRKGLASANEGSFVSEIIYLMERPQVPEFDIEDELELSRTRYNYYKDHYFDNINLGNPGLLRTPILIKAVNEYLDEVIFQHPDTINAELDWIISQVEPDAESYRFWMVTLFTKYQQSTIMGMDAVMIHLAENYYLNGKVDWVDEESITKLADEVTFIKPNLLGNDAPPLKVLDSLERPVDLRDVKAEYTILYFYDPDCGHCKKKTPILLDVYHGLKSEGVEVMAVCTVTDTDKWKKYINEVGLDWINAADPYYRSNFRRDYNVRSTPTIFVVDSEKKIIAKKLDVDQLADFIRSHRKMKESSSD